jgi:phage host-nuclease inhibitor protein Gam
MNTVTTNADVRKNLKRLFRLEAALTVEREKAAVKKAAIDAKYAEIASPMEEEIASIKSQLEEYHREIIASNPEKKTLSFDEAVLRLEKASPVTERNDATIIEFCEHNNLPFVKLKKSLDWQGMKKQCVFDEEKGTVQIRSPKTLRMIKVRGVIVTKKDYNFSIQFTTTPAQVKPLPPKKCATLTATGKTSPDSNTIPTGKGA